ncbi:MAG TPA: hypothetical protein VM686_15260 [Polyangiaceae bacterium]|jgi:hypothetical protein|nr:hypothetical protein [Polyangiaceae bacterium]
MRKFALLLFGLLCFAAFSPRARADQPRWTERYPAIVDDVRSGQPLTLLVVVALCDSALIACGGQGAGDPGSLDKNLYWGRAFGARRYFDETARKQGWQRVARQAGEGPVLEQLVYRRWVKASAWDPEKSADATVEQLVVLRAVHGKHIDDAVLDLYRFAGQGAEAVFEQEGQTRRVPVHVVGYAGHNRLMDGVTLTPPTATAQAVPSFVFACRSAPYFSETLSDLGSQPLVMTRDLMAPEGYIIEALARGLGDHATVKELRARVVASYARWQRIPERTAGSIFAR